MRRMTPITAETICIWNIAPGKKPYFYSVAPDEDALAEATRLAENNKEEYAVTKGNRHTDVFEVLKVIGVGDSCFTSEELCVQVRSRLVGALLDPPDGWKLPEPDMSLSGPIMSTWDAAPMFGEGEARLSAVHLRWLGLTVEALELDEYDAKQPTRGMYCGPSCLRWKRRDEDYFIPAYRN